MTDPTQQAHQLRQARTPLPVTSTSQGPITSIVLTGVSLWLLTIAQEPWGVSWVAWFALVPWILASVRAKAAGLMALISYVGGSIYFLGNLYWLWPVTGPGTIALAAYLGVYFPLCGFVFRRVYLNRRWAFTLVVPLVWVGQEYLRAWVFTGFPWYFVSHTQHNNLALIQVADLVGAYGVTFLVAMVNGLLCDLLLRPLVGVMLTKNRSFSGALPMLLLTTIMLIGALAYGYHRLRQSGQTMREGPLVTAVQDAVQHHVKENPENKVGIFENHLRLSREALAADVRPDLIVWPETMVTSPVNPAYVNLHNPRYDLSNLQEDIALSRDFDQSLRDLAAEGAALLVGTPALKYVEKGDLLVPESYNSAMYYLSDRTHDERLYHKMHRVPFGEFLPFHNIPWLFEIMLFLSPYDFDYSILPGTDPVSYELPVGENLWRFGVAICYEDVIPWVPRRLTEVRNGRKASDFLLVLSTEGWYVFEDKEGNLKDSAEHSQHLAISRFRAIENRVGLVRAVNMGISAFIRPDGVVQQGGKALSLPEATDERTCVSGYVTDRVIVDSRITVYNRVGDVFAIGCAIALGLLLIDGLLIVRVTRKQKTPIPPIKEN